MMFPVNAYNWLDSAYDAMVENEKRIQHRAQQRRDRKRYAADGDTRTIHGA